MKKQSMVVTASAKELVAAITVLDKANGKVSDTYKVIINDNLSAVKENCFGFARGCFTGLPTNNKGKAMGMTELMKKGKEEGGELQTVTRAIQSFCTWYTRNASLFLTEEELKQKKVANKRAANSKVATKQAKETEKDSATGETKVKTSDTPLADAINLLEGKGYRVLQLVEYNDLIKHVEIAKTADDTAHERVKQINSRLVEITKDRDAKVLCLRDALKKIEELEKKLAATNKPAIKKAKAVTANA